jgi:hypothetical protein
MIARKSSLAEGTTKSVKPVSELLFDNYPLVAKDFLAYSLDSLIVVRSHFGGDLDAYVVFLLIALRTAEDPRTMAIDPHAVRRGEVARYPSLLTNVRSVAASTGIPYETARRKVAKLIEQGWVERRAGSLSLTVKASTEFRDVREKLFAMVEGHHAIVSRLLAGAARG